MDRPLLTELSFDLQVQICECLNPPQILTLRQTSKAFHQVTSQRIVWIHALNRICHYNFLFLPTFPIHDMSVAELERAATAPFRWIALSSSTAKNNLTQLCKIRIIKNLIPSVIKNPLEKQRNVYLVPGGRYLVISGRGFLGVYDLGYVSDSESGGWVGIYWQAVDGLDSDVELIVHPTSDGLGIRIIAKVFLRHCVFYVFEVYPQQQTPQLAKLAEFTIDLPGMSHLIHSLNGNRVVIYGHMKRTFIVWDFMAGTGASWSITIPNQLDQIIRVTETVIVMLDMCRGSLFVFEIPPLKAKKTLFNINEDLPIVNPVFSYEASIGKYAGLQKPDGWYSGDLSSLPLCISTYPNGDEKRCKLDITHDFSTIRLIPIAKDRRKQPSVYLGDYRICDGRFVNVFALRGSNAMGLDLYAGLSPSSDDHAHQIPEIMYFRPSPAPGYSSFCPASGRIIFTSDNDITIVDLL